MGLYFDNNFCMHRFKLHEAGQREQGDSEVLSSHTKDNQQRPQKGHI